MSSEIAAVPDDAVLPARLARQFRRLCDISQVALARDAQINYTRLVQFEQQRGHLTHEERQRCWRCSCRNWAKRWRRGRRRAVRLVPRRRRPHELFQ